MPKMFVNTRRGLLTAEARVKVAASLTALGKSCERLVDTEKVNAGIWVFFSEHEPDTAFSGGKVATVPIMSLVTYTLTGGMDEASKKRFITEATAILGENTNLKGSPVPLYVGINEVPEIAWGMYGNSVSLAALRGG